MTRRLLSWLVVAWLSLAGAGCATVDNPDPFEKVNRGVFAFNEAADEAVIRPVATVYRDVLPMFVRTGFSNFFGNVRDAWSSVNLFLQGRFAEGFSDMMRFGSNTVFGMLGVVDVATELGFERHGEDFGLTLGRWGVPSGAYIVWPIFGPSTVRDSVGLPVDQLAAPQAFISPSAAQYTLTATQLISTRASLLQATNLLDDIALDKYTFVRDAYLQRRRSRIFSDESEQ
ncbi:phospholipid-binding lipoprotein MlaA [Sphaerotilus hippei]|uniref:Phospholipid-binding lipoprotein MlaA n=1 Tax=Sphaerotilus hippei TaxID=744406 RepID=A0A318HA20_9BURK|nr:VacJ family lipoprotein [Sphaerotilus hippei]PXW97137.1 phospholipid-binding lipoprotein MlaA [Sphaerotilus hippei]